MTTNQTIDGVRKLAEQACGTSPDSPAYRRFIAAMNPTLMKLNTCLDAVTRLNSTRPTHAIPPPGTEPSGTYHDNDGLDEMRKPK